MRGEWGLGAVGGGGAFAGAAGVHGVWSKGWRDVGLVDLPVFGRPVRLVVDGRVEGSVFPARSSSGRTSPVVEQLVMDARRRLRVSSVRIAAATGVEERTFARILRRNRSPRLWDCDPLTRGTQTGRAGFGDTV